MRDRFLKLLAIKHNLLDELAKKSTRLEISNKKAEDLTKARALIIEVSERTQDRLKTRVEGLVTMALNSVFDRPFKFQLLFEQKRNKIECTPVIIENENVYDEIPDDLGGGLLPVVSFALRVVFWSLENPQSRNVIILDEPIKGALGGEQIERAVQMYKEISHKLGIQLLFVTHNTEMKNIADKTFNVKHNGKQSIVKEV